MAIMERKPSITKQAFAEFDKRYDGKPMNYGNAFYKHFRLDKLVDQSKVGSLKTMSKLEVMNFLSIHMKVV